MKQISVRQFQRNFYKELKDAPLIIVRQHWLDHDGKKVKTMVPEFIVCAYTEDNPVLKSPPPVENTQPESLPTMVTEVEEPRKSPSFFSKIFKR